MLLQAISTIVVFRKDIFLILKDLLEFKWNEGTRFSLLIIVSMIPAILIGLLFEEKIEAFFDGNIVLVGCMLLVTALLLLLADQAKNTTQNVSGFNAFIVGIAQAVALLPGISRSGATISTSVLLKIDRSKAAKFSFLMVLPLIFAKMAKDIMDGSLSQVSSEIALPMTLGFIAAFLTGLVACTWMIKLVKEE